MTKADAKFHRITPKMVLAMTLAGGLSLAASTDCLAQKVALSWDASTESSLAGYKVYYKADTSELPFDGADATEGASGVDVKNNTSATLTGLDPGKNYYFAITAYNSSGLESAYSTVVTIPESVAPAVSFSSPSNSANVSGTVSVTASASDNIGVTQVQFYVNGVLQNTETAAPYVYSWNTASLAAGSYTLMAKAYDAAGNVGQASSTVTVVNDTTPPVVSFASPGSGATLSGTVAITANATDNVGVAKVEFYQNGSLLFAGNVPPYSYSWNTASFANGSYALVAKAYDSMGNVGQSSSLSVTVLNDNTRPTVTAFTIPATATSVTVPVSAFTASDNTGVTGYLISESATAPAATASGWSTSAPASFTLAGTGARTAYAWAKDAAGNVSASRSAAVTITPPDATSPTVTAFAMPTTAMSTTVAVSSFTATDDTEVAGYLVTESATAPAATASGWSTSAPTSFTFAGTGARTAYAWAKDAAGNVSAAKSDSVSITLASGTLGYAPTNGGATVDICDQDTFDATKFTMPNQSGTATMAWVYIGSTVDASPNNQYQVAIYSDNARVSPSIPSTRIAVSGSGTLHSGWNSIPISATLNPNTTYWVAFNTNASVDTKNNVTYDAGSTGSMAYLAGMKFGTWPSKIYRVTGNVDYKMAIYLSYQ